MKEPLITIITVCFNSIDSIEQTIKSVLAQDYNSIEYIVIDGGSTDGTVDIIKSYSDRINYWISEPDKGIYDAMNKGVTYAHGEWIHFRNSGDYFLSKHTVSEVFKTVYTEDVGVVHGDCYYVYKDFYVRHKPALLSRSYKEDMPVLHPATFVRLEYHKEMPFDLEYKSAADYNFFYHLCERGVAFYYNPLVIASFAMGGFSSNWERAFIEDRKIQGKMNSFWGKCYVFYELWKRKIWKATKGKTVEKINVEDAILGQICYDY